MLFFFISFCVFFPLIGSFSFFLFFCLFDNPDRLDLANYFVVIIFFIFILLCSCFFCPLFLGCLTIKEARSVRFCVFFFFCLCVFSVVLNVLMLFPFRSFKISRFSNKNAFSSFLFFQEKKFSVIFINEKYLLFWRITT
jgi:hypothetical protein